jgi:hypothetical protein
MFSRWPYRLYIRELRSGSHVRVEGDRVNKPPSTSFGGSRVTKCLFWFIDSVTLNAYMTATSKLTNVQPLNVQCERIYSSVGRE